MQIRGGFGNRRARFKGVGNLHRARVKEVFMDGKPYAGAMKEQALPQAMFGKVFQCAVRRASG
jgi:hypothetical protein